MNQTAHESTQTQNSYNQVEDSDIDKQEGRIRVIIPTISDSKHWIHIINKKKTNWTARNTVITAGRVTDAQPASANCLALTPSLRTTTESAGKQMDSRRARIAWNWHQAWEWPLKPLAELEAPTRASLEDTGIIAAEDDHR